MNLLGNIKSLSIILTGALAIVGCADSEPVEDDFYWLDESFGTRALEWVDNENLKTLKVLATDSRFKIYKSEAESILTDARRVPIGDIKGNHTYNYWQDAEHPYGLWRRSAVQAYLAGKPEWETILDLDQLSMAEGREWFFHGADCRVETNGRCLVRLAHKSQDTKVVREYDLTTKQFVADGFTVPEGKFDLWWEDDDTVILAADFGQGTLNESDFAKQLRRWKRGTPLETASIIFESDDMDIGVNAAFIGADGKGSLIAIRGNTFFEREYWMLTSDAEPRQLPLPKSFYFQGVYGDQVLMRLNQDWQPDGHPVELAIGSLVGIPLRQLLEQGTIGTPTVYFNPPEKTAILKTVVSGDTLYLELLDNYRSRIIKLDKDEKGWIEKTLPLEQDHFIQIVGLHNQKLLLSLQSFLNPQRLISYDLASGNTQTLFAAPEQFDASDLVTEMLTTKSADGTVLTYTVMRHRKIKMDGSNPALVYGYGGFDVSITPRYEAVFGKLWLEKGGIYVHAYLRGGGEFGPAGHFGAQLENRQQPYDDMAAIVEDLQARGFTSPEHTGIMGRSNGGLMVAAVMEQHPELMNAVVVGGPLIDMLHYHRLPPGASWMGEYGDPREPDIRKFIETYSPQQNLRKDAAYPTPLIITSTWDDRVLPGHARRFAAKMAAYSKEALYFEDVQGGHYWELAGGPPPEIGDCVRLPVP